MTSDLNEASIGQTDRDTPGKSSLQLSHCCPSMLDALSAGSLYAASQSVYQCLSLSWRDGVIGEVG